MRHPDAYAYSDCNVYSNAYSYSDCNVYSNAYCYGDGDVYSNAYCYSDGNADANGNAHAAEANTDATAATHAPAQAVARVRSDPPTSGSRRTAAEKLVISL